MGGILTQMLPFGTETWQARKLPRNGGFTGNIIYQPGAIAIARFVCQRVLTYPASSWGWKTTFCQRTKGSDSHDLYEFSGMVPSMGQNH